MRLIISLKKLIYPYHLLFSIITIFYFKNSLYADANLYWNLKDRSDIPPIDTLPLPTGSQFLRYINYPFSNVLGLPIELGYILYSIYSIVGIYFFFKFIEHLIHQSSYKNHRWILYATLLMPSLHFWTSILGKESILFTCFACFIYYAHLQKFSHPLSIISVAVIAIIRPHVFIILAFSSIVYLFLFYKSNFKKKILFTTIGISSIFFGLWLFTQATWMRKISLERIEMMLKFHQETFKYTSGYVPLEEYYFPYKIFTFYFRPFPFEFPDTMGFIYGIENFIFLILFSIFVIILAIYREKIVIPKIFYFIIILSLVYASIFVLAYSNFGLIARTKILITPFLCTLFLFSIFQKKSHN